MHLDFVALAAIDSKALFGGAEVYLTSFVPYWGKARLRLWPPRWDYEGLDRRVHALLFDANGEGFAFFLALTLALHALRLVLTFIL